MYAPHGVNAMSVYDKQKNRGFYRIFVEKMNRQRRTPIPFIKRQTRFNASPSLPGMNLVMRPDPSTVKGRKAPKRQARKRSSGYQKPRFALYLITILSDIQPASGAPTREWRGQKCIMKNERYVAKWYKVAVLTCIPDAQRKKTQADQSFILNAVAFPL